LDCDHLFKVTPKEVEQLCAREFTAASIQSDVSCPSCGYNLKTLRIGYRCPECGATIRPERTGHFLARVAEQRRRQNVWIVFTILAALAILVLHNSAGIELLMVILGAASSMHGFLGLRGRSLRVGWTVTSPLIVGAQAVFWGVVFVVLGVAITVLACLMWFGIVT
jgi:DNA-directed RNA polymerase subunit RPC12/RpoP